MLFRKLVLAVIVGVVMACAIPASTKPAVWRDVYEHQLGWGGPGRVVGLATWYDATKNHAWYTRENKWGGAVKYYAAAGPALRSMVEQKWMMKPVAVWVRSLITGKRLKVYIVDWCGCYGRKSDPLDTRLVDLAPAVWHKLGVSLGRGVMKVEITLIP